MQLIFSVAFMQLTAEDIRDIVRSQMIDHQQLRIVDLGKHSKYLGGCKIGDEECKYLKQANWPNLQELVLCKYS